jgi:uncharacterized protein
MNCRDATRFMDAYSDGELDLASAMTLEGHLNECQRCRAIERNLRALRRAVQAHTELARAPARLRGQLAARFDRPDFPVPRAPRRAWIAGVFALGAAALLGWTMALNLSLKPTPAVAKVVYHINNSDTASAALRTLGNHLEAAPGVKVVVVAHNAGVDFLLKGARDESGQSFATVVRRFRERGVEFRVCQNTLNRRKIEPQVLIPDAVLVPSGIAEIGRLQSEEGYVYTRL